MNAMLILFYLLNIFNINNDVTPYYKEAYNYILNDSFFKEQCTNLDWSDTAKISVSSSIWNFKSYLFNKEIIDYEFSNCSDSLKDKIEQFLSLKQDGRLIGNDNSLDNLSETSILWTNVSISFSELIGNKLIAEIRIVKKPRPDQGQNFFNLAYLFYFYPNYIKSNQWKIEKVFHCIVIK